MLPVRLMEQLLHLPLLPQNSLARVAGVPFRAREKSTSPSRPKPPTDLSCARKGTPATQARKSIIHTQARPSETFSKR